MHCCNGSKSSTRQVTLKESILYCMIYNLERKLARQQNQMANMFKSKFCKSVKAAKQQPVFKLDYLDDCYRTYSCIHCRAHLANHDELISKLFQGNHGRAYLFNKVTNIGCKQAVQRELLTGLHDVADIYCNNCETVLGWAYVKSYNISQKYKEGKFIIELTHLTKENKWDLTSYNKDQLFDDIKSHRIRKHLPWVSSIFREQENAHVETNICKEDNRVSQQQQQQQEQEQSSNETNDHQVRPLVSQTASEINEGLAQIQVDMISNGIEMMKLDLQNTKTSN